MNLPSSEHLTNGSSGPPQLIQISAVHYMIQIILSHSGSQVTSVQMAAAYCFKSYMIQNDDNKRLFLTEATKQELANDPKDRAYNFIHHLLTLDESAKMEPSRIWLASLILMYIIEDDRESKRIVRSLLFGNEEIGEDPVSTIQTISANLGISINQNLDIQITAGYLMLLCIWLYEDEDSVRDFLTEGSTVQTLAGVVGPSSNANYIVQGLSAVLLGILNEFNSDPSDIPP